MPDHSTFRALFRVPRHPRSLAAAATGADRFLGLFFLAVGGLLVAGWTVPIMTIRKLIFFAERISILEGAATLWSSGDYFLFLVVFVFSVVFPALKTVLALLLWYGADAQGRGLKRALARLEALGRWSMLDVFVAALIVVAVQVSLISEVTAHPGLYVFTAAVVLSLLGVRRLTVLARRALGG
ncbi:MAG: paraquat-inducible protein A [Kiloniellaceae bacterium]